MPWSWRVVLRRGSNVYEVNLWLWSFARGKPRLGGVTVDQTFERQIAASEASKEERAVENCRHRKAGKDWFKVKKVFTSICTEFILVYISIYQYVPLHSWTTPVYTNWSQVTVCKGTKLHFKLPTAERRHILCVGVWWGPNPRNPPRSSRVCPL